MDDFIKRGLLTYGGLTASIWLISFSMTANGANLPSNFGWPFISFLRRLFTGVGVVGVMTWFLIAWISHVSKMERKKQEEEKLKRDAELAEQNRIKFENENIKYEK